MNPCKASVSSSASLNFKVQLYFVGRLIDGKLSKGCKLLRGQSKAEEAIVLANVSSCSTTWLNRSVVVWVNKHCKRRKKQKQGIGIGIELHVNSKRGVEVCAIYWLVESSQVFRFLPAPERNICSFISNILLHPHHCLLRCWTSRLLRLENGWWD